MRPSIDLRIALTNAAEHVAQEKTFSELVNAYCAVHFDGAKWRMAKWVHAFADTSAWEITTEQLQDCCHHMLQSGEYKVSTINRDISQIGSIYKWAIYTKRMAPKKFVSPSIGVPRYDEEMRIVEISDAELDALLKGAHAARDRRFPVYVRLLAETGCRKGELLGARWAHVDLHNNEITVLVTKTGKPRVLHFSDKTLQLMLRVWPKRDPGALLFEGKIRDTAIDYRSQWTLLTKAIGRPDLHQHDLRHRAAAAMLKAGKTVSEAAQTLGHSSLILHRRYGHLETAHQKTVVSAGWTGALA